MLKIYIINMAKIQIIKVAKQISISGGSNSAHSANSNDKNTKEYFAKIWLTARNDADDIFYETIRMNL